MTPVPHRVVSRTPETADTWTLELEPLAESIRPRAGQFDMLHAFGVGEVPISTSGDHEGDGPLTHTIRAVGAVTGCSALEPGAVVGVRGPFGTEWPLAEAVGGDLVVVAGGSASRRSAPRSATRSSDATTTARSPSSSARERRRTCSSWRSWSGGERVSTSR